MSENQGPSAAAAPATGAAGGPAAAGDAPITLHVQYIKDLSFEAPGAPRVFQHFQQTPPEISVAIDVRAANLQPDVFEVVIRIHSECKSGETVGFILELVYGGTFTLKVPQDQLELVLLIECPRLLFPFARHIVADITRDGGFPPLLISPVDFVQMYRERKLAAQQAAKAGDAAPASPAKSGS
ncbi:MAG: protein-export chaperone SecB [Rhodospirillales bacterium]|nr:protein-export chaperone SecB [Rhodospirillales bacterium]